MAVGASEIVDRQLRQPGAIVGAVEFLAAGMRAPRIDLDGKDRNVEAAFCWRASARRSRERAGRLGRRGLNFRSWAGAGVAVGFGNSRRGSTNHHADTNFFALPKPLDNDYS